MPPDDVIVTEGLRKDFGEIHAVCGVDLRVSRGQILSLLGPNGAGKTTTIAMLSCLLAPTAGDAWVMGHSVVRESAAVRRLLGVVPQDVALYADLSARENLAFWGRMYGLGGAELAARIDRVLADVGLADRQKGPISRFSGGMKRRLNLAVALVHRPPVVYLDEPTVGVDPQSRRSILDGIKALRDEGVTVLYTTHYMEEAEDISDTIAIMDHGEIIATGTQAELVRLVGEEDRIRVTVSGESEAQVEPLAAVWRQVPGVAAVSVDEGEGGGLTLLARDGNRALPRLFEAAVAQGARITSVDVREPNLETVFLHLTGRALRD